MCYWYSKSGLVEIKVLYCTVSPTFSIAARLEILKSPLMKKNYLRNKFYFLIKIVLLVCFFHTQKFRNNYITKTTDITDVIL